MFDDVDCHLGRWSVAGFTWRVGSDALIPCRKLVEVLEGVTRRTTYGIRFDLFMSLMVVNRRRQSARVFDCFSRGQLHRGRQSSYTGSGGPALCYFLPEEWSCFSPIDVL